MPFGFIAGAGIYFILKSWQNKNFNAKTQINSRKCILRIFVNMLQFNMLCNIYVNNQNSRPSEHTETSQNLVGLILNIGISLNTNTKQSIFRSDGVHRLLVGYIISTGYPIVLGSVICICNHSFIRYRMYRSTKVTSIFYWRSSDVLLLYNVIHNVTYVIKI